jgi:hypothetical protein
MKRGYVYDIFPLFTIILLFAISLGIGGYLAWVAEDTLDDYLDKGYTIPIEREEFTEQVTNNYNALDFVIPLLITLGSITMIISGYTSQSPSTLVVLFVLIAIIGMIAIVYLNEIITDFWGYLQLKEARFTFPYTTWVIQNLPMILGLTLLLTGLFMHSKTQTMTYR